MSQPHRVRRATFVRALPLLLLGALSPESSASAARSEGCRLEPGKAPEFPDLVCARRRLEQLAHARRIWPAQNPGAKPPLDAALPPARIEELVREDLALAELPGELFGRPIDATMLQAELDRMARETRDPDRLREMFAALGNDAALAAEAIARPALARRLASSWFAFDSRFHGSARRLRDALSAAAASADASERPFDFATAAGDAHSRIRYVDERTSGPDDLAAGAVALPPAELAAKRARLSSVRGTVSSESADTFVVERLVADDASGLTVDVAVFPKESFEQFLASRVRGDAGARSGAPSAAEPPADGFRLPAGFGGPGAPSPNAFATGAAGPDEWVKLWDSPTPRWGPMSVWTGSELILWGGRNVDSYLSTGARFNPATSTWTAMSHVGAPSGRAAGTAVWTGQEMIVYGGADNTQRFSTGGRYDPETDTWTATNDTDAARPGARYNHSAVWTGTQMLIWGGDPGGWLYVNTGSRYTPTSNSWTAMPVDGNTPGARGLSSAVWTGSEMVVFGGERCTAVGGGFCLGTNVADGGARFNAASNAWTLLPTTNAPTGRYRHSAVWTGSQMVIWGGGSAIADVATGARWDPVTNLWTATSATGAPSARGNASAVWTGSEMILWGGRTSGGGIPTSGARYRPANDTWVAVGSGGAPPPGQYDAASCWTGSEMVIFGGAIAGNQMADRGGRYSVATDSWVALPVSAAPAARRSPQPTVWTGAEMILWGGEDLTMAEKNTGVRFVPATATFTATDVADPDLPSSRNCHSMTWTGTEIVVFGGTTGSYVGNYCNGTVNNTGGRYSPAANNWAAVSTGANVPTARVLHHAVWSGTEVIVWGGDDGTWNYKADGARYSPAGNAWTAMNDAADVDRPFRRIGAAAFWAGGRMVIWGGKSDSGTDPRLNTGGLYDPTNAGNPWVATSLVSAPAARHEFGWANDAARMYVFGGDSAGGPLGDGGIFSVTGNSWTAIPTSGAPAPRRAPGAVFTGTELLVYGGFTSNITASASGGRYTVATSSWAPLAPNHPLRPEPTGFPAAYWTGSSFLLYGGSGGASGGIFYPDTPPLPALTTVGTWDTTLQVPRCTNGTSACSTGTLVVGRGTVGPESNAPNTLADSCADGNSGSFHFDESLDRVTIQTADGSNLSPGARFVASLLVWGWTNNWEDSWYLWHAPVASAPIWGAVSSGLSPGAFAQTVAASGTLGAGTAPQAIRGQFRYLAAAAASCSAANYDDNDDVAFAVDPSLPYVTFTLGSGGSVALDGSASRTGTNPETTNPASDTGDSITAWEWFLNEPAGFGTGCAAAASGVDRSGATATLVEADLASLGLATVGDRTIWLRVTDLRGGKACRSGVLRIVDGTPPTARVVAPNGGESWDYSPSVSERRTHVLAWSSADAFGLSRTKLSWSADGGTTWRCIADSAGTSCPAAGLLAEDRSYTWTMPTAAEALVPPNPQAVPTAQGRVRVEVWDMSSNTAADGSDANVYFIQPTTSAIRTLIVWNSTRIQTLYGVPERTALETSLGQLADHPKVNGFVLDLASVPAVVTALSTWDGTSTSPATPNVTAANNAATAIRTYLMTQAQTVYTNTEYIVLAGDDRQIPFFRRSDGTSIYPESVYPTEVAISTATPVGCAISSNNYLSDSPYGETAAEPTPLSPPRDLAYLPDFSVGRLVETPAEMRGVVDAYLAQDGEVTLLTAADRVLVTGFDFLYDSAVAIRAAWAAKEATDCLLDDPNAAGSADWCVDKPYSPTDLANQLLGSVPHRFSNVNTHANHLGFATSSGNLTTAVMDADPDALTGTVLATTGCHSGLPVPSTDPFPLDLPQVLARKRAVAYVGNTGYGWGLTNGRGLTERLLELLSDEMLGAGQISVGHALAEAKRRYWLEERRWDVFDDKVVHEATLFGIPNYRIVTSLTGRPARGTAGAVREAGGSPAESAGAACPATEICVERTLRDGDRPAEAATLLGPPAGVTQLDLSFAFGSGTYSTVSTPAGSYFRLNGVASGEVGNPIQPQFVYDSTLSGTAARGVLFVSGDFTKFPAWNPVIAVPRSTNYAPGGEGPAPILSFGVPGVRSSSGGAANGFAERGAAVAAAGEGRVRLVVDTGSWESSTGEAQRFDTMNLSTFYSNLADVTPPAVTDPGSGGFHLLADLTASFDVAATDASGIHRVLVTWVDRTAAQWRTLDLALSGPGGTWRGNLDLSRTVSYFVQAVDNAGNITVFSISGPDLDPSSTPYGSTWAGPKIFTIPLPDTDSDGMPDAYEAKHGCLSASIADALADPDRDRLSSATERSLGTLPCLGDSDGGGENDGSEWNHGRSTGAPSDDIEETIRATKSGANVQLTWPDALGQNAQTDGDWFVYRSASPDLTGAVLVAGSPLVDGITTATDTTAPATVFYSVRNAPPSPVPPAVAALVPGTGVIAGGTSVQVFGSGFTAGAVVRFCGVAATNVVVSSANLITCRTPPHASGFCDVVVTNTNGQNGSLANGFRFQ